MGKTILVVFDARRHDEKISLGRGGSSTLNSSPDRFVHFKAWLNLLRVSVLFTVPGDPIAGYLLSTCLRGGKISAVLILPGVVSLLIYCAGLLSNDYFDMEEDRQFRPSRPLAAGLIAPRIALIVAILLSIDAVILAWLGGFFLGLTASLLAVIVWGYNAGLKRVAPLSLILMGACRAMSFLLGAIVAVGLHLPVVVIFAAVGLAIYVSAVSYIAAGETSSEKTNHKASLPGIALLIWLGGVGFLSRGYASFESISICASMPLIIIASIIVIIVFRWGFCVRKDSAASVKQQAIGSWLRALILMQSWLVWWGFALSASQQYVYLAFAIALILAWPISAGLAKRFPPT